MPKKFKDVNWNNKRKRPRSLFHRRLPASSLCGSVRSAVLIKIWFWIEKKKGYWSVRALDGTHSWRLCTSANANIPNKQEKEREAATVLSRGGDGKCHILSPLHKYQNSS